MAAKEFLAPPGTPEVIGKSIIDAPPTEVFNTVTDRKQISCWWGPERFDTVVKKMELRKGGQWRYVQDDPDCLYIGLSVGSKWFKIIGFPILLVASMIQALSAH